MQYLYDRLRLKHISLANYGVTSNKRDASVQQETEERFQCSEQLIVKTKGGKKEQNIDGAWSYIMFVCVNEIFFKIRECAMALSKVEKHWSGVSQGAMGESGHRLFFRSDSANVISVYANQYSSQPKLTCSLKLWCTSFAHSVLAECSSYYLIACLNLIHFIVHRQHS